MYNRESYLRVLISLAILILGIQLVITGLQNITFVTIMNKASFAISGSLLFHLGFSKWFWKLKFLRHIIVKVPNLHGTWEGVLVSSWVDPQTGQSLDPINLKVYIRQTFNSVSIEVHTDKMVSTSYIANFVTDIVTGVQDLCYTYTSKSKLEYRDSNPWHDGTTRLSIYENSSIRLEGEYWTSRKTTGTITLHRTSDNIERG